MRKLLVFIYFLSLLNLAQAQQHLVMVGGGAHPPEAMKAFYDWSGKPQPNILVIGWASSVPEENLQVIIQDYHQYHSRPQFQLAGRDRSTVLQQLEQADAVWFTGGDQNRIMEVLKDRVLLQALRAKYQGGTVFGGTSAGTAIMSLKMLTGKADLSVIDGSKVEVSEGLGLLPESVIVDQHFLRRQRENRLFSALFSHPGTIGIGIDEDSALLLSNGQQAQVVGRAQVMQIWQLNTPATLQLRLYQPGERFQLQP